MYRYVLTFDLILVQERPAAEGGSPCETRPLLVGVEGAQTELTLAEDGWRWDGGTKGCTDVSTCTCMHVMQS